MQNILLDQEAVVTQPFDSIVWVHSEGCLEKSVEDELKKKVKIDFRNSFPEKELKNHSLFPKNGNFCLVIDDSLFEVINNETFANLFIKVRYNYKMKRS